MVKNFSGFSVSDIEKKLFSRGKNFCSVELNPPYIRMQKELDYFFRILRIKWHFLDQEDSRSDLEKMFYLKSGWMPPKACGELENLITQIQLKFDKWKPPRYIKDNLTVEERQLLKQMKQNYDVLYMWEDKGPSFTKLTVDQYLTAGEKELNNSQFYDIVDEDPTIDIKRKCIELVSKMQKNGEISDKVSEYLMSGDIKLSKFYHVIKTHSLPTDSHSLVDWLEEKEFPIRGIISGRGAPTEKLAGLV